MKDIGIYIHIPFCRSKCPYCDFYSQNADENVMQQYTQAVIDRLRCYSQTLTRSADTLYFGGGTPSLLGGERISRVVAAVREGFTLKNAEITVECNPSNNLEELLPALAKSGVNRISLGMQSAVDTERKALGRRASAQDVTSAVQAARTAGISNISLDLMLGIPHQTIESLKRSIEFCVELEVPHISAYLLKIEEGTLFYKKRNALVLPTEEEYCELYFMTCEMLEQAGLKQYEISNFAIPGFESRHNLKYWNCDEYLGIGAAAHSFIEGERFYYPSDLQAFIEDAQPIFDGAGGELEEYLMLGLRLTQGISEKQLKERYSIKIPASIRKKAEQLEKMGFMETDEKKIRLTKKGFLISNTIIAELLDLL